MNSASLNFGGDRLGGWSLMTLSSIDVHLLITRILGRNWEHERLRVLRLVSVVTGGTGAHGS